MASSAAATDPTQPIIAADTSLTPSIQPSTPRYHVLFLCTGNSCRSQMSESLTRHLFGPYIQAYSAGTKPSQVNPYAIQVLEQRGVSTVGLSSKHLATLIDAKTPIFDLVLTVCDSAAGTCPNFPLNRVRRVIHHSFDDPPQLTVEIVDEEQKLAVFERVCKEIEAYLVDQLPKQLPGWNVQEYESARELQIPNIVRV